MKRRQEEYPIKRRSQARMLALQALCAFEAVGDQFSEQLNHFLRDECALADLGLERPLSDELLRFARGLTLGAWAQRELLNEKLSQAAAHWSLSRMTPVDRNVLRLGLYELLEHPETPAQVVINEAIELARHFGDADSPAFVNGVLDAIRRSAGEPPPAGQDSSADAQTNHETDDTDGPA